MNNMNMMNKNGMMNMNNMNMNNNNMNANNNNNQVQNQNVQQSFNTVEFRYIDQSKGRNVKINVQGNSNMTVQQIVNNFRTKLCDDSVNIKQYLLDDKTTLDPTSNKNITELGINDKSVIKAIA